MSNEVGITLTPKIAGGRIGRTPVGSTLRESTMGERITVSTLQKKKERGEKIVMITCYDYPSARLLDESGADLLLVGDSLGDNVLGYQNTVPVTLDEMIHHSKAVQRGACKAMVLADMPFLSYQISPDKALENAGRLMKEAGVAAVKIEGGESMAPTIYKLVSAGVAVMGHVGFTPQSVNVFGGYKTQGRSEDTAARIIADARAVAESGAFAMVLELVPAELAKTISAKVPIPTIGIGAGPHCDGQVQVFHDLFGLYPDKSFRHSKRYSEAGLAILDGAKQFVEEVRNGQFPTSDNSY